MEKLRALESRPFNKSKPEESFRKGTISLGENDPAAVNESGELIGRGLEEYCRCLGINVEELQGKTIVDLGAGITGRFARDLQEEDPSTIVYSVSPDYADADYRDGVADLENVIAATADKLPLPDDSMDYVVSMWMLPNAVDGEIYPSHDSSESRLGDLKNIVHEARRVLKSGSIFALYPVVLGHFETDEPLDMDGIECVVDEDMFLSSLRHELPDVEEVNVEIVNQHGEYDEAENLEAVILIARMKFVK